MILGIGIDLININRIENLYSKFGDRFTNRILSIDEIREIKNKKNIVNYIAKKFSAKEAFSKALGTGIGRGINFTDITITNDVLGKPILMLNDKGYNYLEEIYKKSFSKIKIDISITDEDCYVNTFVIISMNDFRD